MAANGLNAATIRSRLNRMEPAARDARLGDVIYDLVNGHNALCAALDAANLTGLGNANLATFGVKLPEQR